MKRRMTLGLRSMAIGSALTLMALFLVRSPSPSSKVDLAPLLEKVQAIGKLHVVKFTYRDIGQFETSREPSAWLASIPGGRDFVSAATRNETTLSYVGVVEAGVDLSKASIKQSPTGVEVVLPQPEVFRPNLVAEVHGVKTGLFWKDDGIVAKSIENAKNELSATARRQGILIKARERAREQILTLARELGTDVQVTFGES